ncbi:MAG: FKBP-type peptidyl-prolyl cis-trans isomerase [Thermoplasmata archaeon]|nr:FKBP-type peptidyl-prolyl cis-trans isomerase [Thermoplasmata archaeon]
MVDPPSRAAFIVFVVITLAAAGGLAGFAYYESRAGPPTSVLTPQVGGNATVDYIGYFGTGAESGRVFDTSIYSVATNNASFPKALSFSYRGSAVSYTPLAIHVGASTPSGGYTIGNYSFVSVVPGFWQGLIGVPGNTTHTVVIPPSLGYGPQNPACSRTLPLAYALPLVATFTGPGFSKAFPGISPLTGVNFKDPHYGWNVTVLAANSSFVTIQNMPYVGYVASPAGWPVLVTAIAGTPSGIGTISLMNQLSAGQAGRVLGKDFNGTGPCSSSSNGQFIVSAIDPAAGTYTENFNREVTGQVLIFVVTVVDIFPPPPGATA